MRNILYDLYLSWEHHPTENSERNEINNKIISEMEHFKSSIKPDDFQRLEALECLYTQAGEFDEADAFITGFRRGVLLMCAVFNDERT